jgi:O-antigen/teichoic acid export membrane protein
VMNGDILLIGRLLNMDLLGVYNLGLNIGEVVSSFCLLIFMQSFMPAVSSVAHDVPRVMRIYRRTAALVLAVAVPISVVVTLFSSDIIRLLYDPRYQLASVAVYWVSLSGIFRIIGLVTSNTFIAVGKPVYETLSMSVGIPAVGALVSLGALKGGLSGAAFGMFSAITIVTMAQSIYLIGGLKFRFVTALRPWFQAVATSVGIGLIYYGLRPWLPNETLYNLPFLAVTAVLGLGVSGLCYVLLEGRHPFQDRGGATRAGAEAP